MNGFVVGRNVSYLWSEIEKSCVDIVQYDISASWIVMNEIIFVHSHFGLIRQ